MARINDMNLSPVSPSINFVLEFIHAASQNINIEVVN